MATKTSVKIGETVAASAKPVEEHPGNQYRHMTALEVMDLTEDEAAELDRLIASGAVRSEIEPRSVPTVDPEC